jgi:Regulator of Vps4 activity in the MVB pathway
MPPWNSAKAKVCHTIVFHQAIHSLAIRRFSCGMWELWLEFVSSPIHQDFRFVILYPSLSVQRLRILQQKKEAQAKASRRDIATLLERGKIETARVKVENSTYPSCIPGSWNLWMRQLLRYRLHHTLSHQRRHSYRVIGTLGIVL